MYGYSEAQAPSVEVIRGLIRVVTVLAAGSALAAGTVVVIVVIVIPPAKPERAKPAAPSAPHTRAKGRHPAVAGVVPAARVEVHHEIAQLFLVAFDLDAKTVVRFDDAKFLNYLFQ